MSRERLSWTIMERPTFSGPPRPAVCLDVDQQEVEGLRCQAAGNVVLGV